MMADAAAESQMAAAFVFTIRIHALTTGRTRYGLLCGPVIELMFESLRNGGMSRERVCR